MISPVRPHPVQSFECELRYFTCILMLLQKPPVWGADWRRPGLTALGDYPILAMFSEF